MVDMRLHIAVYKTHVALHSCILKYYRVESKYTNKYLITNSKGYNVNNKEPWKRRTSSDYVVRESL